MSWTVHNEYPAGAAFGACFKCRASRRPGERILDPNLVTHDLPPFIVPGGQDGYVYFCEACITEAAQALGMKTPAQVAHIEDSLAAVEDDCRKLSLRAAAAESALEGLRRYDETKAAE